MDSHRLFIEKCVCGGIARFLSQTNYFVGRNPMRHFFVICSNACGRETGGRVTLTKAAEAWNGLMVKVRGSSDGAAIILRMS